MNRFAILILAVLLGTTLFAGEHANKASEGFDKLKSLVGTWAGTTQDGKAVTVSYKLVSEGNVLMESLDKPGHAQTMITMYHVDGDRILMTHYCSVGNEPRMRAKSLSADGSKLSFTFLDITNLDSPDAPHMHGLVFTFKDKDHMVQKWTMRAQGKDQAPAQFDLTRTN